MDVNVQTNIRKTCRTCLRVHKTRKELISVFDSDQTLPNSKVKFSEMLTSITDRAVLERDALPKRICVICLQQVRSAYFFKAQAEDSYSLLLKQTKTCNLSATVKLEPLQGTSTCDDSNDKGFNECDMLVEVEAPKLQNHLNLSLNVDDDSVSDMIVYDPDISDDEVMTEPAAMAESCNGSVVENADSNHSFDNDNAQDTTPIETQNKMPCNQCDICHKEYPTARALKIHKTMCHSSNSSSYCKYCRRRFGNNAHLRMHIKFKHINKYNEFRLNGQTNAIVQVEPLPELLDCSNCGAKFCNKESLYRHHSHCDGKCVECDMIVPQNDYFQHLSVKHGIVIDENAYLECPFGCSDKFFSSKVLQSHVQRYHPENDKESSIADTLSDTEETASNDSFLQCTQCSTNFCSTRGLTHHMRVAHGASSAIKADLSKVALSRNVQKYTRDEFFEKFMVNKSNDYIRCMVCNTDIARRSLVVHLKGKHWSVQPFRCELCPEAFCRSDYRQRHMKYQHRDQYNCHDCSLQFDRIYKFDAHMAQHGIPAKNFKPQEGQDRYDVNAVFNVTDRIFIEDASTYDYNSVRRMSTASNTSAYNGIISEGGLTKDDFTKKYFKFFNETDSRCLVCQQNLKVGSIITHLLWKHAIKKPMKCAFCNERNVKSAARLTHMSRCHPDEYKCNKCRQQFGKHVEWRMHMLEAHNERVTTQASSGEEADLHLGEIRFVPHPNDEEEIEEQEVPFIEPIVQVTTTEPEREFVCKYCPRKCSTSKNLQLHMSHKHRDLLNGILLQQISADDSDSITFDEFKNSYVEEIDSATVKCLVCTKSLRKKNFGTHVKSRHATTGAYKCAVCPLDFFRPEHRIQHMSEVHRGMFFCGTCNIQFYRNSRYAKHMKDLHSIEVDNHDEYEVDLMLYELKFVAAITGAYENDYKLQEQIQMSEQDNESEVEVEELGMSNDEANLEDGMNRDQFMQRYIKIVNKELRRCTACERTMLKRSIYTHLMVSHATTKAFKCPFCDLRLGRAPERMRHIQTFHPDEYKCQECGVQFHKHSLYSDHMWQEHNENNIHEKAEGEEEDLSSADIKYLAVLAEENNSWQDDDNSTPETSVNEASTSSHDKFLRPRVKLEPAAPEAIMHSIFGSDLVESDSNEVGYEYNEFKKRFIQYFNEDNFRCGPCGRTILKTSVCAHVRLYHAMTMSYNCELCSEGFQRADYRQRHMKFSHPKDFNCNICDVQFYRSVLYSQHMLKSHQTKVFVPALKTKEEIDPPLETMKFVEQLPNMRLNLAGNSREPEITDNGLISVEEEGLTLEEFVAKHIKESGLAMTCVPCKVSLTKFSLKKHLKRHHATTSPFFCELCSEGFVNVDDRLRHMARAHPGQFKCFPCKTQFHTTTSYLEHMQISHNEAINLQPLKKYTDIDVPIERLRFRPNQRETEFASFDKNQTTTASSNSAASRSNQTVLYTKEQFYTKFFKDLNNADGDKKTKCTACFKVFSSQNKVFHVYSNHATEKPFKCELCPAKFFFISKRTAHMMTHHPGSYKCVHCHTQFDRANNYINHMSHEHGETIDIPTFTDEEVEIPQDDIRYTKESTSVLAMGQQRRNSVCMPPRASNRRMSIALFDAETSFDTEETTCGNCKTFFPSSRALRTHLRNNEIECGFILNEPEVEKLKEEKVIVRNVECDQCDKKFASLLAVNAHKKFKHPAELRKVLAAKKQDKAKYDVYCDICDFKSYRRDQVEHHVKLMHKAEFHCNICSRNLSNYYIYLNHMRESHPKSRNWNRHLNKCEICDRGFVLEADLESHRTRHESSEEMPNFCECCGVSYHSPEGFEIHNQNHYHKSLIAFVSNLVKGETLGGVKIKKEPVDSTPNTSKSRSDKLFHTDEKDPFENMLMKRIEEPAKKRLKLSPEESKSQDTPTVVAPSDEDKLDYLKYILQVDGAYKCGICGKTKQLRKGMLHHLKQHDEVPSYDCHLCTEKFVFKKKYEKHLECHATNENFNKEPIDLDVDDHPRFQEPVNSAPSESKCDVCSVTFKLKIMLNRHNQQWHDSENPSKHLPMNEQKAKSVEHKHELPVKVSELESKPETIPDVEGVAEEFIDAVDEIMEEAETTEQSGGSENNFPCEKCKFVFNELKFLENHQKFFCVFGQARSEQVVNEQ